MDPTSVITVGFKKHMTVSHIIKHLLAKLDLPILGGALKKVKEGAASECGLWGARALTWEELCLTWDLPALCVDRMVATNGESAKLFWSQPVVSSAPGKILLEIVHVFMVGALDLGWLEPEEEEGSIMLTDADTLPPLLLSQPIMLHRLVFR
eukprot:scaffold30130_cov58-Attheya_sp.AAC.7